MLRIQRNPCFIHAELRNAIIFFFDFLSRDQGSEGLIERVKKRLGIFRVNSNLNFKFLCASGGRITWKTSVDSFRIE